MRAITLPLLGLAALGLLLWRLHGVLSPPILLLLTWWFLFPLRRRPEVQRALAAATVLFLIWVVTLAWHALSPFVAGCFVAYLLDPFVDGLARLRIPRALAAVLMVALLLGFVVAVAVMVVPTAVGQVRQVIERLPTLVASLDQTAVAIQQWMQAHGVSADLQPLREKVLNTEALAGRVLQGAVGLTRAVSALLNAALVMVLVAVVSFYALVNADRVKRGLARLVPPRMGGLLAGLGLVDTAVGAWFRGQLLVAFLVGLLTALGLVLLRAPYAALIGLVAGALNIIPTIGLLVSLAVAVSLAPTVASPWLYLLKVGIVFATIQLLDSVLISALVMRARLGLHPAIVIVSVVAGASLFGVPGVLLAAPTVAVLKTLITQAVGRYTASPFYTGEGELTHEAQEVPHGDRGHPPGHP